MTTPAELQTATRRARVNTLSIFRHVLRHVDRIDERTSADSGVTIGREVADVNDANVITSELEGMPDTHSIVLDVDVPCALVASSTPGHFHLFIDRALTWPKYMRLLQVLRECGVIEDGYEGASIERKHTAVRLPWITKKEGADAQ